MRCHVQVESACQLILRELSGDGCASCGRKHVSRLEVRGAYAFGKLAKLNCVPHLTHGTSTLTNQRTYELLPVASRRTWGPIDNISFGVLSVERDEVTTMAVAIARMFVVPAQCKPRHGECLN